MPDVTLFEDRFVPDLRDDLVYEDVGSECVVWSPLRQAPVVLDAVASVMFRVVDGEGSIEELADDVRSVLDVPADVALRQVNRVVGFFEDGGLLRSSIAHPPLGERADPFINPPNN